jgi:hypothetical protein
MSVMNSGSVGCIILNPNMKLMFTIVSMMKFFVQSRGIALLLRVGSFTKWFLRYMNMFGR